MQGYYSMKPHLILGLVKGDDLCPRVRRRQFRCEVRRLAAGRCTHVQHVRAARDTLAVADQSVPTSDRRQILRGFTYDLKYLIFTSDLIYSMMLGNHSTRGQFQATI